MRARRLILVGLTVILLSSTLVPATEIAWSNASGSGNCPTLQPRTMRCSAEATASIDGSASLTLEASSLLQSYGPGSGGGGADAGFFTTYPLEQGARSITIHARVHVNSATISVVRRLGGLAPGPYGFVTTSMQVVSNGCSCSNSGGIQIVDSEFEPSLTNTDIDFAVVLEPFFEGATIPPGLIAIGGYVSANAGMGPQSVGFGSIKMSADAVMTLTGVDVVATSAD
jgi:hypothetical protein